MERSSRSAVQLQPRIHPEIKGAKPGDLSACVPQVRPQIRRSGRSLFFMTSSQPVFELSSEDTSLYDSTDGRTSVSELEARYPGARERLSKWHQSSIVEFVPPITPPAGPHLVIIEPHLDDAVFSAGGRLLHRRGHCRITVLTVVKWSNFTRSLVSGHDFVDVEEVSQLRLRESALAARMLGATHRTLDRRDALLGIYPSNRWPADYVERFNRAPQDFWNRCPDPREISELAQQLAQELSALAPDELWIPMGLGGHLDHRTTRSACLLMLAESRGRLSKIPVSMYEDLPYAAQPGHAAQIRTVLAACGTRLVRETEDITDAIEGKVRLSNIYASQFDPAWVEAMLRRFAGREAGAPGRFAEAYHRLEGERSLPLESQFAPDWRGMAALDRGLRSLRRKNVAGRRLAVMALPSGCVLDWKAHTESLASAFPACDITVYLSGDLAWQAEDPGSANVKVIIVRSKWAGWVGVTFRELFRFRTLSVIVWRGAYSSTPPMRMAKKLINLMIRLWLPFRPMLFTRRLGDFCSILNEQAQTDVRAAGHRIEDAEHAASAGQ